MKTRSRAVLQTETPVSVSRFCRRNFFFSFFLFWLLVFKREDKQALAHQMLSEQINSDSSCSATNLFHET